MTDSFHDDPFVHEPFIDERQKRTRFEEGTIGSQNTSRSAIILVDFQNEFCKEGGKLYDDVKDMMKSNDMIAKVPTVVRAARDSGAMVIYSPVILKEENIFKDEDYDPYSYSGMTGLFTEGTWNAEIIEEVKPELEDKILENRSNFSAFQGTDLTSILQENGITQVFCMGFLTNVCIEQTVREMGLLCPEITVYVLEDGSASKVQEEHDHSVKVVFPMFDVECISCSMAKDILRKKLPMRQSLIRAKSSFKVSGRARILALAGAKSNSEVTKLQLENLNITEAQYDIDYLHGQIEVEEGDPELTGIVRGPFFSWLDEDQEKLGQSLIDAVHKVLTCAKLHGPYIGIYGFSNGALVASVAADIASDTSLQEALSMLDTPRRSNRVSQFGSIMFGSISTSGLKVNRRSSKLRNFGQSLRRSTLFGRNSTSDTKLDFTQPPFKFVILACAGTKLSSYESLRERAGLSHYEYSGDEEADNKMATKSFHLIGIEDQFKAKSEEISTHYVDPFIMYLPGGHAITRDQRSDDELCSELKGFILKRGVPYRSPSTHVYKPVSEVTSIGIHNNYQIAEVSLRDDLLPKGLHASHGGATITSLLRTQSVDKPFLYAARDSNSANLTTYGDVLKFIQGGDGDLRNIGVKLGEVVAYGAPPGGSAAAAVAFLSIGAQTAAAPLAPGMTEPDVLDALDQFNAKHLILFEGFDNPGIETAFLKYVEVGKAVLHRAVIVGDHLPGLFKYVNTGMTPQMIKQSVPLDNPENGTSLLLRTSGTTARPKGVPLSQGALVTNGAIIARSMQLTESDVCYSVMPLFHIGGISASIMCTMASGGSVCCDGQPFDPSRMVDALALSSPQPTWYSSVPTIHNATVNFLKDQASSDPKYTAYGVNHMGIWKAGHSLRMIRSGAAALLGPDGDALHTAYGGVVIYPTYSMSEQMPISQPPAGKVDTLTSKPGSVGVPVAASTAIVSRSTLRPQPFGVEGEIAISGPTVLKKYLENAAADTKAYFFLPAAPGEACLEENRFFLTGDVGVLDGEGFLSLKGRAKELIKKGGEQVSPPEVEEPLLKHPWVQTPICFAVQSKMYGEEVGCALILSSQAPANMELREVSKEMRKCLKDAQLAPVKWPTKWIVCTDDQLPKTKTKKYIRIGLAKALGLDPQDDNTGDSPVKQTKAEVDWAVIGGFRFFLACYVMFMHIGSTKSWGSFSNLRGFPWHVHVFFTLGGFSMASPMNPAIKKKFSYFLARIGAMYPMYIAALIFGLINLLIVCRPSTFHADFHWDSQPQDLLLENGDLAPLFCEGTPATPNSYWGSLILTVLTYIFGIAVTPAWPLSWWMGYYLWFSSMYYQCLAMFPATYNFIYNRIRGKKMPLLKILASMLILNYAILAAAWFPLKNGSGYNHYHKDTGKKNSLEDYDNGSYSNITTLSFYLFGPFWTLYFFIGTVLAFIYDAYRPNEKHNVFIWGYIADSVSLIMLGLSITMIYQGIQTKGEEVTLAKYMRPGEADAFTDVSVINRIWDNVVGRMACPLTTLWIYALSTGEGYTALFFKNELLTVSLAPNAYNCFLFHQMVGQWYYAATRNGHFWNWWRYRKTHYWFSPEACPVEWYEYPLVVGLVVFFSRFMDSTVQPIVSDILTAILSYINGKEEEEDIDTSEMLLAIVEGMTGIEPELDYSLDECGLASIGVPVLVALLNKNFSTKSKDLEITANDLISAKTILDMVEAIDDCKARADDQGV